MSERDETQPESEEAEGETPGSDFAQPDDPTTKIPSLKKRGMLERRRAKDEEE